MQALLKNNNGEIKLKVNGEVGRVYLGELIINFCGCSETIENPTGGEIYAVKFPKNVTVNFPLGTWDVRLLFKTSNGDIRVISNCATRVLVTDDVGALSSNLPIVADPTSGEFVDTIGDDYTIADLRLKINEIVARLKSLAIVATFAIFGFTAVADDVVTAAPLGTIKASQNVVTAVDVSNLATKADLENITFDTSILDGFATKTELTNYATLYSVSNAIASVDVSAQLGDYVTKTDYMGVTNQLEGLAQKVEDINTPKNSLLTEFIKPSVWTVNYIPVPNTDCITNETACVTNNNSVFKEFEYSYTDSGFQRLYINPMTPLAETTQITNATVVSGDITLDGLLVKPSNDIAGCSGVVKVNTDEGTEKLVQVNLSKPQKRREIKHMYTDDLAPSLRKKINDEALAYVMLGNSNDYKVDQKSDKTDAQTQVALNAYFTAGSRGAGWNPNFICPKSYALHNVYQETAYRSEDDSFRTSGTANGGDDFGHGVAIGKRLVLCSRHVWWSSAKNRTSYVMRSNGEAVPVRFTGKYWWVYNYICNTIGEENFESLYGYKATYTQDLIIHETEEDIPDECIGWIMPYTLAERVFGYKENDEECLFTDIRVLGWSLGQNNSIYPVCIETDKRFYGAGNYMNVRRDLREANYNAKFWYCRGWESGRPVFFMMGDKAVIISTWYTILGGGSLMKAYPIIRDIEISRGRDPDETLKVITEQIVNDYMNN